MIIDAIDFEYRALNQLIRDTNEDVEIKNCFGQRFIGVASSNKTIDIIGTPGNALGSYLDGSTINVHGNAQDAVGDTMNNGRINIYGSAGDALGYAMRGGEIYVKNDSGYRTGIHMKAYKEKQPIIVIGGKAGNYLGEYQAGGKLIILGLDTDDIPVTDSLGTGMHGGEIWVRTNKPMFELKAHLDVKKASSFDLEEIEEKIANYCKLFNVKIEVVMDSDFYIITPSSKNPYVKLYTEN